MKVYRPMISTSWTSAPGDPGVVQAGSFLYWCGPGGVDALVREVTSPTPWTHEWWHWELETATELSPEDVAAAWLILGEYVVDLIYRCGLKAVP